MCGGAQKYAIYNKMENSTGILFQNGLPISPRVKKKGLEPKSDEVQSGITSIRLRMLVVSGYFKPNVTPS